MDPRLDFVLTITGLRLIFEAGAVVVMTLFALGTVAAIATLWHQAERFRALISPI